MTGGMDLRVPDLTSQSIWYIAPGETVPSRERKMLLLWRCHINRTHRDPSGWPVAAFLGSHAALRAFTHCDHGEQGGVGTYWILKAC